MNTPARTVLIVDDDPEFISSLFEVIGSEYPVLSATNGDDAIRKAGSFLPDIILLDVMMPGGKDGFSTFCELQRSPATAGIPVIMLSDVNRLSGLSFDENNMAQYLGKSPVAFLDKSITAERLLDEIRKALGVVKPDSKIDMRVAD